MLSTDDEGQTVTETNSFTELATGLNFFNSTTGQWEESQEVFEITPKGDATATKGQHQVILAGDINSGGSVDLLTPDGVRLLSNPMGLSFRDTASGKNVLIAEVTNCIGQLVASNIVSYNSAFDTLRAGIRYENTKAGLSQDIVLYQNPGSPADYGLNPASSVLEMWTEFHDPATPAVTTSSTPDGLSDQTLDFGTMAIGRGTAYVLNDASASVPVGKTWTQIQETNGQLRTFLIEAVRFSEIEPFLQKLQASVSKETKDRVAQRAVSSREQLAALDAMRPKSKSKEVASIRPGLPDRDKGFVMDYTTLNSSQTNYVWKGDSTYFLSGNVDLYGTNAVFEGGVVLKYTNNVTLSVHTPINWQGSSYRPVLMVSKDDNSVGETISGSTGSPGTSYYASTALYIDATTAGTSAVLQYLRIANAKTAIALYTEAGHTHLISHAQLLNCQVGIAPTSAEFDLRNALLYNVLTNFIGTDVDGSSTSSGENLTVDTACWMNYNLNTMDLTNCLLVAVTNAGNYTPPYWVWIESNPASVFQTVGAASHYLIANSPYRGGSVSPGTTNLDAALLADLRRMTTYPPQIITTDFTANTTLSTRNLQDASPSTVDVGYHYDVLDYAWSGLNLTNATLTVTNGVAVGFYGSYGLYLRKGANLVCEGGPLQLNRLTRYNTVQEQPVKWGGTSPVCYLQVPAAYSPRPTVTIRFTDVTAMAANYAAGARQLVLNYGSNPFSSFTLAHSSLRGMSYVYQPSDTAAVTWGWTNNVFERCYLFLPHSYSSLNTPLTVNLRNNLFWRGSLTLEYVNSTVSNPTWTVKDNAFDNETLAYTDAFSHVQKSYNGFINTSNPMGGSSNVVVTNFVYNTGPLGGWYQASTNFIDAGSRTASAAGLSTFTTTTNNATDSSTVDIGYHYYAVNPNAVVTIVDTLDAIEPNLGAGISAVDGTFTVYRTGSTSSNLTVYYSVGGTAVAGVNYNNNLSGSIVIPATQSSKFITVTPLDDGVITPPLTVTATLIQTNTYLVGTPDRATVSIANSDQATFTAVRTDLSSAIGIDYHSLSNVLVLSVNYDTGQPRNFLEVAASGTNTVTNSWTTLSKMTDEIKLATVKTTASGFTNSDMFYNTSVTGQIGYLSANTATADTNWVNLSGEGTTVHSLYIDQTGVFGNNLVVVTSGGDVWKITSSKTATSLAQIGESLEGVVTIPNNPGQYGPWAGKILAGAENSYQLYTIDTGGAVTPYPFETQVEDLDLIPANQHLYCLDYGNGILWKVSSNYFANYVGDVLVTSEGNPPQLTIAHWDGQNFVTAILANTNSTANPIAFEHVTFAPTSYGP